MADRIRKLVSEAKNPENTIELDLTSYYDVAVVSQRKSTVVIFFCHGNIELVSFVQKGLFVYDDFLKFCKKHRKELMDIEEEVIRDGGITIDIPFSDLSDPKSTKKIKSTIDRQRLAFVVLSVDRLHAAPQTTELVMIPASQRSVWFDATITINENKAAFLPYVCSVLKEHKICPCFPFATRTTVTAFNKPVEKDVDGHMIKINDSLANAYVREYIDPIKCDQSPTALFELLYSLWYLHNDLKLVYGNVKNIQFVDSRQDAACVNIYVIDDDAYIFPTCKSRAMIADFKNAILMRDGPLLRDAKLDSFQHIRVIKDHLKTYIDYDLDVHMFKKNILDNDVWIELYHMIFVIDYMEACKLFADLPIAKAILKLCDSFMRDTISLMDQHKRPKYTFNKVWDDILNQFKAWSFMQSLSTKRLQKYKIAEAYKYNELFNFCLDLSCLQSHKFEE